MTAPLRSPLKLVTVDDADDSSIPDDAELAGLDEPGPTRKHRKEQDRKIRAALADPVRARAKYLEVANSSDSLKGEHGRFRVLYTLALRANPDLTNCFPSRRDVADCVRMPVATVNRHLVELRKAGWIRTHERCRADNGHQSSSDVQFCVPRDVLPLGEPWEGPCEWTNRKFDVSAKPRR
jgi:hypothetical protein